MIAGFGSTERKYTPKHTYPRRIWRGGVGLAQRQGLCGEQSLLRPSSRIEDENKHNLLVE